MIFAIDSWTDDTQLMKVVTLREACLLWGKSPRQLQWAIDRDNVSARKSISGGSWLINYNSIVSHWGNPTSENLPEWIENNV